MVVWKHEFLVILQKFFHCSLKQPCGASLSIHYNGNGRRQLYWSNVKDWPLSPQYKKRPMYWSTSRQATMLTAFIFQICFAFANVMWESWMIQTEVDTAYIPVGTSQLWCHEDFAILDDAHSMRIKVLHTLFLYLDTQVLSYWFDD